MQNYDPDEGLTEPVPSKAYQELEVLFNDHQLFLDDHCLLAMELILESYSSSFPFNDESEGSVINRNVSSAYEYVKYLQPRIASIFRQKIGITGDSPAVREIALLGAMKLINTYYFSDIELPPKGNLRIRDDEPADVVLIAEEHIDELVKKLMELDKYLAKDGGFFHEAQLKLRKYIPILSI